MVWRSSLYIFKLLAPRKKSLDCHNKNMSNSLVEKVATPTLKQLKNQNKLN